MKSKFLGLVGLSLVLYVLRADGWTYEQVDTSGNWQWVEMEALPSGMICICYQDTATQHVFISRKDSVWHLDDLGPGHGWVMRHLVQGLPRRPAVLLSADSAVVYTVDTDTGWTFFTINRAAGPALLALDSSGNPAVLNMLSGDQWEALESWYERDGTWTFDNIDAADEYMGGWLDAPTGFALGAGNQFCFMWGEGQAHTTGCFQYVCAAVGHTGAWTKEVLAGGENKVATGISLAPTRSPGFAACYNFAGAGVPSGFFCDSALLEDQMLGYDRGVIRVDAYGRRQIVYQLGVLKHAYNTGLWHIDTLPPEINDSIWDFAVDADGRPLIAFVSTDGIFLAQGDEVGCAEQRAPTMIHPPRLPTIIRGVLALPVAASRLSLTASLVDASGRKVMKLKAGANDVSRLAPGVYFIAEKAEGSRQETGVRKVIVSH